MRILGLTNARGGSKGIPKKNLSHLKGKPLIQYTIDVARRTGIFVDYIVSTDDQEIADVARKLGADVPIIRPVSLATDTSPQIDTVSFMLEELKKRSRTYDLVVLLQPTSPFRTVKDVQTTVSLASDSCEGYAFTASPVVSSHPYYMYWWDGEHACQVIKPDPLLPQQRQYLPEVVIRNGAVYVTPVHIIVEQRILYGPNPKIHVMTPERGVNINTPFDWAWAEFLLEQGLVSA